MAQGTQSLRKETLLPPQFSTQCFITVLSPPPGIPEAFVKESSFQPDLVGLLPAGALPAFLPPSGPGGSLVPRESPHTPGYCL